MLGRYYVKSGEKAQALQLLEDLEDISKETHISPLLLAGLHISLGDNDQAITLLERAYDEKDYGLIYFKMDKNFDPLRSDPRFQDLMRRMNFPDVN
jgi:tetratricopeptide (TPR) repeat protein